MAIALFACAADRTGKKLGREMMWRVEEAATFLKSHPGFEVLIASTAMGFSPTKLYGYLVCEALMEQGIAPYRIRVCGPSASTVGEIESLEGRAKNYDVVLVATSWYHMFRTRLLWKRLYNRYTWPLVLKMPNTTYIWVRAVLEIPKLALMFAPKRVQDAGNEVLRAFGLCT